MAILQQEHPAKAQAEGNETQQNFFFLGHIVLSLDSKNGSWSAETNGVHLRVKILQIFTVPLIVGCRNTKLHKSREAAARRPPCSPIQFSPALKLAF